jgi:hypothetical protein
MEELKSGIINDRRKQPTPILSRYTVWGRRKDLIGLPKERYVDRYSPRLLLFLILMIGLNYLDACFTMMILENGGQELNPIVGAAIDLLGEKFWIWKFVVVSFSSVILCLHSQDIRIKIVIALLCSLYVGLVSYQLIGLLMSQI